MPLPERPALRPFLVWDRDDTAADGILLQDRLGLGNAAVHLSLPEFVILQLFDGSRTLRDVQLEVMRQAGGQLIPLDFFTRLVQKLDDALFLDGPRFWDLLKNNPVREPMHIGAYPASPEALRRLLRRLFTHPDGPGLPGEARPDGRLRAALVPHMDYGRGNVTYAWGFKEVFDHSDATLFVIIGTSHYSPRRFTLTRKHFKTPLGITPTHQEYIDRLVRHYGDGLFEDEFGAHLPEHSIELEVVFLQFLYEGKRAFHIVPLVVGSFRDCVQDGELPNSKGDVGRMVEALRKVEAEVKEPVCYIISGDLAHVGPKFDDPEPVAEPFLGHSRSQDQAILKQAEAADPAGYFRLIAEEGDRRRICGLPPTYTVLEAIRPGSGKLLHYQQYVEPNGFESVSFASVAFYR